VAGDATAAMARERRSGIRRRWIVLALVPVFLSFGVPRWFADDDRPAGSHTAAGFATLCHAHGGTVAGGSATGTAAAPQQFCTVRYGGRVYRMDAITPNGFDQDTAAFQRQGCEQEQRTSGRPRSFVYHPETGVCEHRS
jgi:hypothetical protein